MYRFELITSDLRFPESPAWSPFDQALYLVEWQGDQVAVLQNNQVRTHFKVEPGGGPSGLALDIHGNFWVCLYSSRKLACYNPTGGLEHVLDSYQGASFRGPCDLCTDGFGGVYFTDSGDYEEDWRSGRPAGAVYYLSPGGELSLIERGLCYPNGIGLAPDGSTLYVNEHRQNRTLRYQWSQAQGAFERSLFQVYDQDCLLDESHRFELGPDGMGVAANGSIWVAHYGGGKLFHLDPAGGRVEMLRLPRGRCPTSAEVAPGERALFITEAEFGSLYRVSWTDF